MAMEYKILNDGQPNDDGYIEAIIETSEGKRVSTFKGKTERELMEQVLTSQVNANREIARLRKPDAARPMLKVEPKKLTPEDRLRLSTEMSDPARVVEAVSEIVTATTGIAPDKLGAEFGRKSSEEQDEFYAREAQAFRDSSPDFYPVPQNRDALFEELKANGWDLTRNNLSIAFDTLKERGDLIPWPNDRQASETQHEPDAQPVLMNGTGTTPNGQTASTASAPRPRTIATTGLRHADASASAPPPPPRKQKYTRADIEMMSRGDYNRLLQTDPDFRRQVDAMGT
jgi:hypothetical protein